MPEPPVKPIQLFVPTFDVEACLSEIRECLEIGWTGLGFKTTQFEQGWRTYTGLPNAHFVNSNTAGLHLAVKILKDACGWADGDEIISTTLTFVSTNHVILYERLRPVFADVDDSLCLDPDSIAARVTPRTRAVMYVGFGGTAGRLAEVSELCRRLGLKLILDAAHMSGTRVRDKHVGHEAEVAVFSFQAVKNLPTADSGMICFRDSELDQVARKMSWLGIDADTYARSSGENKGKYKWLYEVDHVGLKAHGNSIVAAIAIAQLKHLDSDNDQRRALAALYRSRLKDVPGIGFVSNPPDCTTSQHLFQIRVSQALRDSLIVHLNSRGIFPGVHYKSNLEFKMYREARGTCPRAEKASLELVSLPLHLRLTPGDVERVGGEIEAYLGQSRVG
ncbi:MAG: DegT/DnrJ/EryC1/StrS family aminotransferase [Candidatus Riflebacteria bacterium]|nr:DegT/DnrJ/EryC1/StrS family aminotransferase [Candidatus Riflebacteria bacterium]